MSSSARVCIEPEPAETPKRRQRSIAEKRRIVEETYVAGASVARVARAHGVNANQVFSWRRLYQRGLLGAEVASTALLPVTIADSLTDPEPARLSGPSGSIQLRLPKGQLRIEGAVDPASLRVVLGCLLG